MVQPLKYYPDDSINILSGPMRGRGETLDNILEDMIDTMKANSLDALSAIQIGYPYQVMVIKDGDEYREYLNPRMINNSEPFESIERSVYFKDHDFGVTRYKNISVVYEDKNGDSQVQKITDSEKSATFQRKLDYLFNASLLDRQKPARREQAISALAGKGMMPDNSDAFCPTESKRDYFVSVADKLLIFMGISLLLPLFGISESTLQSWYSYDKFAFVAVILLMIGFFIYAWFEAKKFKQCTSCQVGNNIGVVVKRLFADFVLGVAAYFVLG